MALAIAKPLKGVRNAVISFVGPIWKPRTGSCRNFTADCQSSKAHDESVEFVIERVGGQQCLHVRIMSEHGIACSVWSRIS